MPYDPSQQNIGQSVGAKIRAARIAKKYTQSHLAQPDFSVSYISAIERGQIHPSLRALEILAGRFGLRSTELLPKSGEQNESTRGPSPEEIAELALLEAQVALQQKESAGAIERLEKLTNKMLTHRQQVQKGYLLGMAYAALLQFQEAEAMLSQAIELAREKNDRYSKLQLHYQLGITYAATHNYAQAISCHLSCLKLLEEIGVDDAFLKTRIYFQLGQQHAALDHHEQAIAMFEQA